MERAIVTILLFLISMEAFSDASSFISEEMERIVQVKTQGNIILSDAMIAVEKNGHFYLPLNEFFEATGMAISVGGEQLLASGFIVDESNTVRINFSECVIEAKSVIRKFDCGDYFESSEGLYGSVRFLEIFLPMKIKVDSLSSTVNIEASRTLPPVAKLLRDKKDISKREELEDEKVYETKREWFDGVNFDQDISTRYTKSSASKKKKIDVLHQTSLSAEFLKSEFYTNYTGTNEKKESWWLSLERNDYRSRIFGDVGLSEVKLYNFNTNSLKLIGGGRTLKGLYFSNRPLNTANRFSTQDFSGALDNGWEVELYHNDVLIGREVGTLEKQRYEFREVDLYYGLNSFHFIFYGPKGELKHRYQNFNIENMFLKTKRPIISLAIGRDENDKEYQYAEIDYLLFDRLFVEMLQAKFNSETQKQYYGLNLSTFIGGAVLGAHSAYDETNFAQELSLKFNLLNINSNISYAVPNGFKSELINKEGGIKDIKRGTFLLPIPFFSNLQFFMDLKESRFEHERKLEERYRLSLSFAQLYFSSTFEQSSPAKNYEFFARYNWRKNQLRFTTHANDEGLQDFNLDVSFRNNSGTSLGLGASYSMNSNTEALSLRYDKLFDTFSLGTSARIDDKNNTQLYMNISYGGVFDKDMGVLLFNKRTSEYGNAKIVAFVDKNENGVIDNDERPLSGVEFRKLAGNQVVVSDDNGRAFFSMLQPHRPTDFKVSMKNIDNIFLRPKNEGLRLWPRAGKTSEIFFPLSIRGEVEGEIDFGKFDSSSKVEAFIEKENGDKRIFEIDRDGYFLVDNVGAGNYVLVVKCITCDDKIVRKNFSMPKEGDTVYVDGLAF